MAIMSPALARHRWILNAHAVAPADLETHLRKERDHYSNTSLVAGVDPRDGKTLLKYEGHELIEAHMDRGIRAALAVADGITKPVHVTLYGLVRNETDEKPGDELVISVSIAQKPAV